MSSGKTVLILGGGVGGLVSANLLRERLSRQHRVVLIEREARHVFAPSLLWLMTGSRRADEISRPLSRLRRKGIELIQGEIEQIRPATRSVTVNGESIAGDHLVIALGAELAAEAVPGLAEAGHNFYTLAGAEALWGRLRDLRSGRLVVLTATPAYKCPAAPYEAAMLLDHALRRRKVRGDVQIDLYAAEPGPMGVAGPEVSAAVRRMVEEKGIGYYPEHQVNEVDPVARRITFASGASAEFDLLAYVPPHQAPGAVRVSGLTGETGWIAVDRHTLETGFEGVYAIGDVTGIPLAIGKPLPKAGVFAHRQAVAVARNIAHSVTGKGKPGRFDGHGECFIETGDGRAGFGSGDFYAEPRPIVRMRQPALHWRWAKIWFEKHWFRRWL